MAAAPPWRALLAVAGAVTLAKMTPAVEMSVFPMYGSPDPRYKDGGPGLWHGKPGVVTLRDGLFAHGGRGRGRGHRAFSPAVGHHPSRPLCKVERDRACP